jgi:hypothetical protein
MHDIAANRLIRKVLAASGEAHKLAFAAIPVNALFDKCDLQAINIKDAKAAAAWQDVYEDSDLDAEADAFHRKAGYFGDYYIVADPQGELEDGTASDVIVVGVSPLTSVVVYSPRDGRAKLYGGRAWDCGDHWEAILYYDDATVLLATPDGVKEGDDASLYEPLLDTDDNGNVIPGSHIVKHVGGRMLIEHFRVDERPYGRPVHVNAYGPQDAINKIHATELASMDYQGFPQRWALLDGDASIDDDDIDEDFGTDGQIVDASHPITGTGADGYLNPVTGKSKLDSTPGSAWMLSGVKNVGQFDAANVDNFLKPLDWEVRAMGVLTGTPLFEFDIAGEQPSGESRRRASSRINKHANKVMRSLGQSWENLALTVLGLMGMTVEPETITAAWAPVDVELDIEGLALVTAKIKAGVTPYQAFVEAGYDPDTIEKDFRWKKNGTTLPPDLWVQFGDLMRFLTQAQAGDVIYPAEVAALIPRYLTVSRSDNPMPIPAPAAPPMAGGMDAMGVNPFDKTDPANMADPAAAMLAK